MNKSFPYIVFIILTVTISCKKNDTADPPVYNAEPTATAVGVEDGDAVTQTIGSSGGTIVSTDGIMELIIPAGALNENTGISIQPITNKAPNGRGKGYRCLPDGLVFEKDITIKFHYTDEELATTQASFMGIAFQNAGGYWQVLQHATNDTIAKVISSPVNHFTDFVSFDALHIEPSVIYMKPGEAMDFQVFATDMIGEDDSVLIGVVKANTVTWSANGKEGGDGEQGTIGAVNASIDGGLKATYTAPSSAPPKNPVVISAALAGAFRINGESYNKIILTAAAYITGKRYKVSFEYESTITPSSDSYTLKDNANYNVSLTGTSGIVSEFVNPDANLQKINGNCTDISYNGTGPIDIRSIHFMEVYNAGNYVRVQFDDTHTIQGPKFSIAADCNGGAVGESNLGIMPAIAGSVSFTDNGKTQTFDGSVPGLTLLITVTPIP